MSVNRAAAWRCDAPARPLIECSWHFPGSVIIPTGICLALENGAKFLLANTKTKDVSLAKQSLWERGGGQRQCWADLAFSSLSARLAVCQAGH